MRRFHRGTKVRTFLLGVIVPLAAGAWVAAPVARADTSTDYLVAIQSADPDSLNDVATDVSSDRDSAVTTERDGFVVDVPVDPTAGISLTDTGTSESVTIGLPSATDASMAQPVATGVVAYDSGNGSATVPIVKDDESVEITTVIDDANAPNSYVYPVTVPDGGAMSIDDSGAVTITDAQGDAAAVVAPAWAKDANGQPVPTGYELQGNNLVQFVDLGNPDITFPVVADPLFRMRFIARTEWNFTDDPTAPRLYVYPTLLGRAFTGPAMWSAQWRQVLQQTPGHRGWVDTNDMKWQFWCHLARGAQYVRDAYHLETNRQRGSFADYIANQCN